MSKTIGCGTRIFVAYSIEMGATQSSSLPSKEEILRKTSGGRDIVNQVFDWMVNKTSLRELYTLANPEKCKQYIFLTADALDIMFKKIDIEPREGKKGTIYFQKVEELTRTGSAENARAQQRKVICLKLAFLYVRIFQVFASLALSVLDVNPEADIRLYQELGRYRAVEEEVPLFGETKRGVLRGGAIPSSRSLPSLLEPLRRILNEVTGDPRYIQIEGIPVYIDIRSMDGYGGYPLRYDYTNRQTGKKEHIKAKIRAESRNLGDEVVLTLTNIRDTDNEDFGEISFVFKRSADIGSDFKYKRKYTYVQVIAKVLETVKAGRDLKEESMFEQKEKNDDVYDYNRNRRDVSRDEYRSGSVSEGLHTESLVKALRQALPPKAHCVARALQLLSDAGLKAAVPAEIYSNICQTKFLSENRSLPPGNESITKSIGIYAMAQLFYDTIRGAAPEISEATKEQYNAFLMKMKFVFEESSEPGVPKGLDYVRNKLPSSVCDKDRIGHVLKVSNRDTIRLVRAKASQMLNYQITHTANVMNILRKLFLLPMDSGKPLQIHPNVKKNGLEEVNRIAQEARTLLIAYYSDCEIMYRQGVEVFAERKDLIKTI